MGVIDTDRFSGVMRARLIQPEDRRILITDFRGSAQEADLTVPANCNGLGRIRHFRRATAEGWPPNPLPIDPATRALGQPMTNMLRAQVFQNAGCNWRCWYCFVPFDRLAGDPSTSRWMTAGELVESYLAEPDRPHVIDLTGGQPDLVPEWTLWMISALEERGLNRSVYLWSDDNLSTDLFFRVLNEAERQRIASYRMYGRVGCFKGFDAESFSFNTGAAPELFDRQFVLMNDLLSVGLDMYAYVTLTAPSTDRLQDRIARFVDRLQTVSEFLPLRTVPLKVEEFSPVRGRMTPAFRDALIHQNYAVEAWLRELETRFTEIERAAPMPDVALRPAADSTAPRKDTTDA